MKKTKAVSIHTHINASVFVTPSAYSECSMSSHNQCSAGGEEADPGRDGRGGEAPGCGDGGKAPKGSGD